MSIMHDAITGGTIAKAIRVAHTTVIYSNKIATTYPNGFLQSNGNLQIEKKI